MFTLLALTLRLKWVEWSSERRTSISKYRQSRSARIRRIAQGRAGAPLSVWEKSAVENPPWLGLKLACNGKGGRGGHSRHLYCGNRFCRC